MIELNDQPYEAEAVLQRLLADHPNILAGAQIDPTTPRRWLLITREAAISSEEGGSGRWALDHLFLDQDAIPTLIEVKRSSDTRTRREASARCSITRPTRSSSGGLTPSVLSSRHLARCPAVMPTRC